MSPVAALVVAAGLFAAPAAPGTCVPERFLHRPSFPAKRASRSEPAPDVRGVAPDLSACIGDLRSDLAWVGDNVVAARNSANHAGTADDAAKHDGPWRILFSKRERPDPNDELQPFDPATRERRPPRDVDEYLIRAHGAYLAFRHWVAALDPKLLEDGSSVESAGVAPDELTRGINDLDQRVHGLLDDRGLRQPFSAVLVPAVIFGATSDSSAADDAGSKTNKRAAASSDAAANNGTDASGYVLFESRFMSLRSEKSLKGESPFYMSVAGKLGVQPVLTLVKPADNQNVTSNEPTPQFQKAFVWEVGPHLNWVTPKGSGALTLLARFGQTRLLSDTSTVQTKGGSLLAVDAGGALTRWVYEAGVKGTVFLHGSAYAPERANLSPLFELGVGYRHDGRFGSIDSLDQSSRPARRRFFRFALNGLTVANGNGTFTLSFAVEHEGPWRRGGGPSGTLIYLQGRLDLLGLVASTKGKSSGGSE